MLIAQRFKMDAVHKRTSDMVHRSHIQAASCHLFGEIKQKERVVSGQWSS